jgi:hypothetical protein
LKVAQLFFVVGGDAGDRLAQPGQHEDESHDQAQ